MLNGRILPLRILSIILLCCFDEHFRNKEDWKKRIPLIGVCKLWTNILRPVIYNAAYIDYYIHNGHARWITNIDCIGIRGWYTNLKKLSISIISPVDGMLFLDKLKSILQLDNTNWTTIKQLSILFNYNGPNRPSNALGKLDLPIVEFTQKLISNMPNIKCLRIWHFCDIDLIQQLIMLLVNAYAGQLKELQLSPILNMPTTHLGSNLVLLVLEFDKKNPIEYKMSICAEPLRKLCLVHVPVNIPWHMFHGYSNPGQINFKSLQKLYITYAKDVADNSNTQITSTNYTVSTSNDGYTYKLLFPNLRVFDIQECPNKSIAFNAEFGQNLDTFSLSGTIQNILKCVTIVQSNQQIVIVIMKNKGFTAAENTNMLNKLLKVISRYQCRRLYCDSLSAKFHLSSIVWGNLNELNVLYIEITDIITLLSTAPRLKELIVISIMLGDCTTMDKVEQLFQQRVDTRLFALDLKILYIRKIDEDYDYNAFLAAIYNIMTRAKSLTQIKVPDRFIGQVMSIIDAQKDYYPHFSKMHVSKYVVG